MQPSLLPDPNSSLVSHFLLTLPRECCSCPLQTPSGLSCLCTEEQSPSPNRHSYVTLTQTAEEELWDSLQRAEKSERAAGGSTAEPGSYVAGGFSRGSTPIKTCNSKGENQPTNKNPGRLVSSCRVPAGKGPRCWWKMDRAMQRWESPELQRLVQPLLGRALFPIRVVGTQRPP